MPATATSKQRPPAAEEGMTPKKTALIIVTVIGCIAILWPKVFHPMMFGGVPPPKPNLKDQRAAPGGLRQERPAHLHPESIYQAMKERGRAIPATQTVPILEQRKTSPSNPPPRIVDGRPGPIPGMRPPMGAGALHQPQQRGSSMGFLMPLYTVGIVVFFGYTLMKIMFKKQVPNEPYGPAPSNPSFRQEVFGKQNHSQVEDLGSSKLGWREHQTRAAAVKPPAAKDTEKELYNASLSATEVASSLSTSLKNHQQLKEAEQLMEIEKLRQKLESTERAMAQLVAEMNTDQYEAKKNDNEKTREQLDKQNLSNGHASTDQKPEQETAAKGGRKRRDLSAERELTVLGMELTASCEGGHKWTGRPPTPVFRAPSEHSKLEENLPEPQTIYLEGALAHESQILVADSQTKEEVYDSELNGSAEEPAIILSSRMTLSLINLDANQQNGNAGKSPVESPLADDIEIIGHDEQ
ncbi:resistance to inhibitors of cholinesterase protein 3 isoform X5 [Drosophila subpulchrella]|uniref:resistance to inhibitors of cholinesterase protein 3 isoform X5 n=1 Tax=Drosophila subpulchrella TaxID=1486046 RepID=UPI0018A16462|nr:resistance to inhibitors of cholinesterase protein 3 isoform X5 [Drosophila subpulchrella]